MPARHHIQLLKLNFLYDILQQEENSLMFRFFLSQKNNPVKGDWVSDVLKLVEDMNLTCDQIKNMKHSHFLKMVKSYVHSNAINYLKGKIKSKGKEVMYGYYLETQNYLLPNNIWNCLLADHDLPTILRLMSRSYIYIYIYIYI